MREAEIFVQREDDDDDDVNVLLHPKNETDAHIFQYIFSFSHFYLSSFLHSSECFSCIWTCHENKMSEWSFSSRFDWSASHLFIRFVSSLLMHISSGFSPSLSLSLSVFSLIFAFSDGIGETKRIHCNSFHRLWEVSFSCWNVWSGFDETESS